jgi:hypothetical protein
VTRAGRPVGPQAPSRLSAVRPAEDWSWALPPAWIPAFPPSWFAFFAPGSIPARLRIWGWLTLGRVRLEHWLG